MSVKVDGGEGVDVVAPHLRSLKGVSIHAGKYLTLLVFSTRVLVCPK